MAAECLDHFANGAGLPLHHVPARAPVPFSLSPAPGDHGERAPDIGGIGRGERARGLAPGTAMTGGALVIPSQGRS